MIVVSADISVEDSSGLRCCVRIGIGSSSSLSPQQPIVLERKGGMLEREDIKATRVEQWRPAGPHAHT